MFGARRLSLNRYESVVALTPNIGLTSDLTSRHPSIGIDAALDLRDAFGVAVDHACDCDRASYKDCANRNQQTTQAQN
jgi:hypothetical protein